MQDVIYFAYGSNMESATMKAYAHNAKVLGKAKLVDHDIRFNKISKDGSGKANIIKATGKEVWGVAYSIDQAGLSNLDDKEVGYRKDRKIILIGRQKPIQCTTYVSDYIDNNLRPNGDYKERIIRGSEEHRLPKDYINKLKQISSVKKT